MMSTTREYPVERLRAERDAGLLICRCYQPVAMPLVLWRAVQCERCGRQVVS